ncbi:MAG: pilus assembly protein PilM [Candidatus Omnitrophota bacterium]
MFKKFHIEKSTVVVEIGNDWLKAAKSVPTALGGGIEKADFAKLAEIEGSVDGALASMFKEMKSGKRRVISYIPRQLATVRILELPSADPKEISDMVNLQAGKQTPYSKEEIISSYKIIDTAKEGYTKVMLVIARQNIIRERVEALAKTGVGIEKMGLSTEGVYNWFRAAYSSAMKPGAPAAVLLDIDSNYSDFIVINKGMLAFTRNILIGANQLLGDQENWRDKFIGELKHSMELYRNEDRDVKIAKMFLSGAAGNIKGLDAILSAALDMPAETTDPLKNIRLKDAAKAPQDEKYKRVSVSALFGIAINHKDLDIDLTPGEIRVQKVMDAKRRNLMATGVLSASIIMMASILLLTLIHYKNLYLAELKNKISQVENNAEEVEKMRARVNLIERRLDSKGSSINILNEIAAITPKEISLNYINVEEKQRVVLRGRAYAMSDVFKFVMTLEASGMFKNVKPAHTTTAKDKDAEYAEFEIICAYEG